MHHKTIKNKTVMKKHFKLLGAAVIIGVALGSCETDEPIDESEFGDLKIAYNGLIKPTDNSIVLKWNEAVSKVVDNKMPPPPEARIYAMVMLAMHDALNQVIPYYETYALDNSGVNTKGITRKVIQGLANAAASQAAHDVLVALVPATERDAGILLEACLEEVEASEYRDMAIDAGARAAAAMLLKRSGDLPLIFQAYPQGTEPGQYRSPGNFANPGPNWPANAAYAPDLGELEPFGVLSSDQFRAIPPYSVGSFEYADEYNEVKLLGSNSSTARTPEQAEMGLFFLDNVASSINRVVRVVAVKFNLDCWETARLLALVHMAQFDAVQSSFEGKYHYNLWRPETAIRLGELDGNGATTGDAGWSILSGARNTPPTPTYPSTHAEAAGAVTEILHLYFKRDNVQYKIGSYSLPGVERSFSSFSQFASECAESRIYIGYHFRNDVIHGEMKGRELARFVFANNLRAL